MKKLKTAASVILLLAFLTSALVTAALAAPPSGCKSCKKQGCPQGYCYFDCESCCYLYFHQVYCFK